MFYSAEKAAPELGVQPNTIREWDKSGKLTKVRRKSPTENHLFNLDDLKTFMKTNPPTEILETVVDCPFCKEGTCSACQGEKKVWIRGHTVGHPLTEASKSKSSRKFTVSILALFCFMIAPLIYVVTPSIAAGMTNSMNEASAESKGLVAEKVEPKEFQGTAGTIALGVGFAGTILLILPLFKTSKEEQDETKFIWEFQTMGSTKETAVHGWRTAGKYEIPTSCHDPVGYIKRV